MLQSWPAGVVVWWKHGEAIDLRPREGPSPVPLVDHAAFDCAGDGRSASAAEAQEKMPLYPGSHIR
jgi:hypothetical protein